MEQTLIDLIATRISEKYTFINSNGNKFETDGYDQALSFLNDVIYPQVDKYVEENYWTEL